MSHQSAPKMSSGALAAEQARLARFFETINKHRKALDLAAVLGCGFAEAENKQPTGT